MKILYVNVGRPAVSGATITVKELLSRLPKFGVEVGVIEILSKGENGLLDVYPEIRAELEERIIVGNGKLARLQKRLYMSTIFKRKLNKILENYDFVIGTNNKDKKINMIYAEPFIYFPIWKFYYELVKKTNPVDGTFWFINNMLKFREAKRNPIRNVCAGSVLKDILNKQYNIDCIPLDPPAGVDMNEVEKVRPTMDFDAVQVSRLGLMKGTQDTIEVMKELKERGYYKLAVAGPVDFDFNLNDKIKGTGIIYLGELSREMVFNVMKSSRLFIYPTYVDSFGIVVAEALASGVPVVTYDIPAIRHYFGECEAVKIVKVGDLKSMTKASLEILNEHERLSKIALECSKRFSWDAVASSFASILIKFKK
ncbi:glycosyltransferase family 4 protein [Sulfuracidifex metallicus]|uniref:glycosyltransferase family 4 protein n=1 Tax=Sulfuracidifex metallicus TaxID=47303 RepID=UPI00227245A2|nr:glycosyltransferase family 4 protein [Sulfuracidifex metallicus]MCY0850999.1 glycosyltransferase family 4 protein [Sulfuracidifex metallicus]